MTQEQLKELDERVGNDNTLKDIVGHVYRVCDEKHIPTQTCCGVFLNNITQVDMDRLVDMVNKGATEAEVHAEVEKILSSV